jgi:hypothetical protein
MKQINNTKSEVYLSTFDNSDTLLLVNEEYKNLKNVCVAVKFGDIVIKISPRNTCKCTWGEAMEKHKEELMNPAFWQMVGTVYHEVNQALEKLGHDPIRYVWTDTEDNDPQYSGYLAWSYYGTYGNMEAGHKNHSRSVRATKVYKID